MADLDHRRRCRLSNHMAPNDAFWLRFYGRWSRCRNLNRSFHGRCGCDLFSANVWLPCRQVSLDRNGFWVTLDHHCVAHNCCGGSPLCLRARRNPREEQQSYKGCNAARCVAIGRHKWVHGSGIKSMTWAMHNRTIVLRQQRRHSKLITIHCHESYQYQFS